MIQGDSIAVNSACGLVDCRACLNYLNKCCKGCFPGNRTLIRQGKTACAIYICNLDKGTFSCLKCADYPCERFRQPDAWCALSSVFDKYSELPQPHMLVEKGGKTTQNKIKPVSEIIVSRLVGYLGCIEVYDARNISTISSEDMGDMLGIKASLVRKDLSFFGGFGTPKVGYGVKFLRHKLADILKLGTTHRFLWIGVKKFRQFMPFLHQFTDHGYHIVALMATDHREIGKRVLNLVAFGLDRMEKIIKNLGIKAAVIATNSAEAQQVVELLVQYGVRNILNHTGVPLSLDHKVNIQDIDFSRDLRIFSYYYQE